MPLDPRRLELLNRRWRDTNESLADLEAGELWHPLSEQQWRSHLLATLDEIEGEIGLAEFE